MREIKFRAWCESKHKYFMPEEMAADQFTILPTGFFINVSGQSTSLSRIFTHDEYLPEQYTGLKDKIGTAIFEGDIVQGRTRTLPKCQNCGHFEITTEIGQVKWSDYDYDSDRPNNRGEWNIVQADGADYQLTDSFEYEVIGNIHENPELLK